MADFRGQVVFLNFWATWCTPCRWEMPSMDRLYRQLAARGLAMLAVDSKESRKDVTKFMSDFSLSFQALLDTDGSVSSRYRVNGFPSTYIIDPRGRIVASKVGPRDWATPDAIQFFAKLLQVKLGADTYAGEPVPTMAIASKVSARSSGVEVHASQEPHSPVIAKLEAGDELATSENCQLAGKNGI